jgi:hypothetical protein
MNPPTGSHWSREAKLTYLPSCSALCYIDSTFCTLDLTLINYQLGSRLPEKIIFNPSSGFLVEAEAFDNLLTHFWEYGVAGFPYSQGEFIREHLLRAIYGPFWDVKTMGTAE